ncbi:MAG: ATP-binding cassette domain-containing protein [Chitinophagaceae bacterium]
MPVLQVNAITIRGNGNVIIKNLSFSVARQEQWAIVGPSGSGKTSLLQALSRNHFYSGSISVNESEGFLFEKIVLINQQHHFKNLSNTSTFYYQQRYNSSDAEDAITVKEALDQSITPNEGLPGEYSSETEHILDLLRLRNLLPVKLIQLSNGENKRLQIAKALLLQPTILLLDSPFTGLDVEAREVLVELLHEIIKKGIHIIVVTSPHHIPDFITHVLSLEKEGGYTIENVEVFRERELMAFHPAAFVPDDGLLKEILTFSGYPQFEWAVRMQHVHVEYNNRKILDDISWEVRNGECWSLSGPNGSGKSTLLSLINADNPQAYANEIYLFDRKRGSGETIWEIKKKIGFVSPELHLYFDSTINCFDVVASGLFDTIGLFRFLNEEQSALVIKWMKLLQVDHTRNKLLFQLSNSEQRLVLLARALVKNPPMLILDEPCQGLDEDQVILFRSMVNEICMLTGKTLIYVSHYRDEIPACVTKFIRLENGRKVNY